MLLADEIKAIMERDPAATTVPEALLYPSLHAITIHRAAHALYLRKVPFFPRLLNQLARFLTGIDIHPGATIGRGLFIDHGVGVVIGETAEIGDNVTLYQGVTLGGTGKERGKRHPTLGDNVLVSAGAKVLGAITIGDNARIGAGAVVLKDVPPNTTAVGVPAKIVAYRVNPEDANRRVESLPDPEGDLLNALQAKSEELEARLRQILNNHTHEVEAQHHEHETVHELKERIAQLEARLANMEKTLVKVAMNQAPPKNNFFVYNYEEAVGSGI